MSAYAFSQKKLHVDIRTDFILARDMVKEYAPPWSKKLLYFKLPIMKTHLPKKLLVALLAAMTTGALHAAPVTPQDGEIVTTKENFSNATTGNIFYDGDTIEILPSEQLSQCDRSPKGWLRDYAALPFFGRSDDLTFLYLAFESLLYYIKRLITISLRLLETCSPEKQASA